MSAVSARVRTWHMIADGSLAAHVADEGLRGVTSNLSIFAKALEKGDGYDPDVARAATAGESPARPTQATGVVLRSIQGGLQ